MNTPRQKGLMGYIYMSQNNKADNYNQLLTGG